MPVTTKIITCLVGNPYKSSLATVAGWGVNPTGIFSLVFLHDLNGQWSAEKLVQDPVEILYSALWFHNPAFPKDGDPNLDNNKTKISHSEQKNNLSKKVSPNLQPRSLAWWSFGCWDYGWSSWQHFRSDPGIVGTGTALGRWADEMRGSHTHLKFNNEFTPEKLQTGFTKGKEERIVFQASFFRDELSPRWFKIFFFVGMSTWGCRL